MKKLIFVFILIVLSFSCVKKSNVIKNNNGFKDGDIIFHTSKSSQSKMLKLATNSNLTHVGIIFHINNKPYVFEAVQPVSYRPLNSFINSGKDNTYKVLRYKRNLTENEILNMKKYAMKQMGKNYDLQFGWDDNQMYCSELVYKIYESAGIQICSKNKFSSFNLSNKIVRLAINQRYTQMGKKFNINETVVAPIDIANSWNLVQIKSTYGFLQ